MGPLYIPSCNSPYFNVELSEELENDIEIFSSSQGSVLLMGDLNARTGKYSDRVQFVKREITLLQTTNQNSLSAQPRELVLITN